MRTSPSTASVNGRNLFSHTRVMATLFRKMVLLTTTTLCSSPGRKCFFFCLFICYVIFPQCFSLTRGKFIICELCGVKSACCVTLIYRHRLFPKWAFSHYKPESKTNNIVITANQLRKPDPSLCTLCLATYG